MIRRHGRRFLATLAVVLLALAGLWLFCPRPALYNNGFSTAVLAKNGDLLRLSLAPDGRYRLFTPLNQIAPSAIDATLLYEDQWFFDLPGVNPLMLLHAAWVTYVTRQRVTGASTITMQLARMRFNIDSSTIPGKIEQILRALQLERHYSKRQILEAYLNEAPYGGNIEGMGTASRVYFGKPASDLTPIEAMTLAVIPQNPNARQPQPGGGPPALISARKRLFHLWQGQHPKDIDLASRIAKPFPTRTRADLPFRAPDFVRMVLKHHSRGGSVHSTLSSRMQKMVEQREHDYIVSHRHLGIHNAAVLVVDTRNTSVRALVGSADWFNDAIHGQVNGTTALRSPGSAMKPFVYALGLQEGVIQPMTLMKDAPSRFGAWTPENFDRGFDGPVLARDALIYSRNVPAVKLESELTGPDFYTFLKKVGLTHLQPRSHYGLALVLGGFGIRMTKMAALYAALANGGVLRHLALTQKAANPRAGQSILTPEASFITLQMLARNPRPNPPPPAAAGKPPWVAWKTGTSSGFRDAWSVGVVGHYVIAVWVGNFNGEGNPAFVGRQAAAPLLFSIVDALVARHPGLGQPPAVPAGLNVRRISMCAATGGLPGRYCPHTEKAWFIPGVSPISVSHIFRRVRIDPKTGLRLCPGMAGVAIKKVYEFWPSDLLALFREAGLPRRSPPPYMPGCHLRQTSASGMPPRIQAPQADVTYALRPQQSKQERIPFHAVTGGGVRRIYWFVNAQYVGTSTPETSLMWQPRPGIFQVRAVDDMGRADSVTLHVRLLPYVGK